jgi:aryl-alcohol dehydrogenase-like predicted oxidoreductase
MNHRDLGDTGYSVSEIGLGTWQIGSDWGDVTDETGRNAVETALDTDITFLDTADVYGDGRSERHIASVLDDRGRENAIVATKVGRRLDPHEASGYDYEHLSSFADRSRENLGVETIDLLQLHCPPWPVYYHPETFDALADLREDGVIDHYGVSVETVEQAMKAIEYPGVETVQLVFNPFRQRPNELFFREANRRNIGVIVRVPLASGLLTGALSADEEFAENDHRNFNREGDAFDRGETFAGVPFGAGLEATDALSQYVPEELSMAQFALRWILDHDAVSTVIPGSTDPDHIRSNAAAAEADPLSNRVHGAVRDVYDAHVADAVHHRW